MWEIIKSIISVICVLIMSVTGGAVLFTGAYGLKHKGYMPKWESIGMICWGILVIGMAIGFFVDFFFI